MSKSLPDRPNLDHLREQAKDLLRDFRKNNPAAVGRFAEHLPAFGKTAIALHDAQSVIAREYGQPSWAKLVEHVEEVKAREGITPEIVESFIKAAVGNRVEPLRRIIELYPGITSHDAVTRLVSGNGVEFPPDETVGPLGWKPLAYVSFSRVHQVIPEARQGLEQAAQSLLDAGADPNTSVQVDRYELPILYGATCQSRHMGIAKMLLDAGAQPNDGESVFHAAQADDHEMLELLISHGGDISGRHSAYENTPLYFLAGYRRTDSGAAKGLSGSRWLLEHGADPNITSGKHAETPLHKACIAANTPMIKLLLKHGADPNAKTNDGRTPYKIALQVGGADAAQALEDAGADTTLNSTEQFLADTARGIVRQDRPELTETQKALICKLAEHGNAEGVKACLANGFAIDTRGEENGTALHFACYCGWNKVVDILMDAGAPIDLRDSAYNATPFQWALEGGIWNPNAEGDYGAILKRLLAAGANREEMQRYADSGEYEAARLRELGALG